ncbi:MAG: hypothetical protein ACP5GO_04835 [Thermoprotei archaeon]
MSGRPVFSFPYQQEISGILGKSLRPRIPLQIKTKSGKWVTVSLYLDTGADISILPKSMSDILGVNLKSGNEVIVVGLAGELIRAYLHDIECKIEGSEPFTIKFAISEKESIVPILGREGIFQRFNVRFNNVASQVELDAI